MADRYPLIYNPSANQIQELQSGDSLDVGNGAVKGATGYATTTGTSSQFLKADGSLDGTTYLTASGTAQLAQGLTGTPTIDVGDVTGVNATFSGNLTVNGTTTTIDTAVTEVDSLEIAANNNNVAVAITQSGAGKAMTVEGGDVGIGTNNPVERLHLAKNSATGPSFYITNDSTGHTNADGLQIGFDGSNNAQIRNRENTELKLYTNNTPRLTVTNNGFVGIGTDAPDEKLHVYNGAGSVTSFVESIAGDALLNLSNSGNGNYSGINFIRERGSGQTGRNGGSIFMPSNTANNEAFLYIQAQSTSAHAGITSALSADNGVRLKLHGDDGIFSIETGDSERLRITNAGNIGIGTINPGAKLHIESAATTAGWQIRTDSVGLSNESGFYRDANDNYEMVIRNGLGGLSYIKNDGGASTANLRFYAQGSERLSIDSSGHILPGADNTQDLGSSAKRFANIYTGDLNLSNEGSANDVDGTWGQFTIQEGEDDLFLINRRTGKKYKFNLTEVD